MFDDTAGYPVGWISTIPNQHEDPQPRTGTGEELGFIHIPLSHLLIQDYTSGDINSNHFIPFLYMHTIHMDKGIFHPSNWLTIWLHSCIILSYK